MSDATPPHVQEVSVMEFAGTASRILQVAWAPPTVQYTPEYLRFHLGFPSTLKPIGLAMIDGDEPQGFMAATGRNSTAGEIYYSSFLAFCPGSNPIFPIVLIRRESYLVEQTGAPTLLFARVGSAGEKLLKCRVSAQRRCVPLGTYRVHAAVPTKSTEGMRVEDVPAEKWAIEARRLRDRSLLSPAFFPADMQHYAKDPHGRRFLTVINADGAVVCTAMLAITPAVTVTGLTNVPTLHYVRLANPRREVLTALLTSARHAPCPVVTVPNMSGISAELAAQAGLRPTPSSFAAYLFTSENEVPFRGTDFEIV